MKRTGLTLVELLVVIVILGILAGLLFSAGPSGKIIRAQAIRMAGDGQQLVTSIISMNIDREVVGKRPIWPGADEIHVNETTTIGPYDSGNSETYFADLIEHGLIDGIDLPTFAGGGVRAALTLSEFRAGGRCVWNVLSRIDRSESFTPFMYTRNLDKLTEADLRMTTSESWQDKLDKSMKPLGKWGCIQVTVGRSVHVYPRKELASSRNFMHGATNMADVVILKAR